MELLERHLEGQLRSLERQLVVVRFAVAGLAALSVVAFRDRLDNFAALLILTAAVVAYNFLITLVVGRFPAREVGIVATALDMVAVTVAVYLATGALDLFLFYGLVILSVALRFGLVASVWSSLLVSFMYVSVVLASPDAGAAVRELLPVRLAYLIGIGWAAGLFSRIVIGRATENARLQQRLAEQERARADVRERELLAQLGRDFGASLELDATARAIVGGAAPLLGDVTWLMLADEDDAELRLAAVEGRSEGLAARLRQHLADRRLRFGEGLVGASAGTATPVMAGPKPPPTAAPGDPDAVGALGLESVLAVPILARGRVRGVLASATRTGTALPPDQRRLAELIAERAGPALENADLWADLQEQVVREQQAQRIKDDFLSIVSHELRTPLTSIQGYAQLLEGRLRPTAPENSKELSQLRVIRSQATRMRRLVDDLLDVSRIDRLGGVSIEPVRVDLAEELRELVARVGRQHPQRSLTVSVPEHLPIEADRDRIDQVLNNLLENAIKYSPDGSPVEVNASSSVGHVTVSVADAGVGIPPEHIDHVFERFYQGDEDVSRRRFGGLGLGLYISRAIVDAHGGEIWAAPNRMAGRGSVFSFRIPVRQPVSITPPLPTSGEPPAFVLRRGQRSG